MGWKITGDRDTAHPRVDRREKERGLDGLLTDDLRSRESQPHHQKVIVNKANCDGKEEVQQDKENYNYEGEHIDGKHHVPG